MLAMPSLFAGEASSCTPWWTNTPEATSAIANGGSARPGSAASTATTDAANRIISPLQANGNRARQPQQTLIQADNYQLCSSAAPAS